MIDFRKEIIAELKNLLKSNDAVFTVWEGGSAATGYLDDLSDLDLGVICKDDAVEEVFEQIEKYLENKYGIETRFRMPEPTWHGHSQCFYILKNSPPLFYVDLLIEKLSAKNRFMESDRHGNSQIWFDKKSLMDPTPTPEEEIREKGKKIYKNIKESFPFLIMDAQKQIFRKNKIDAFDLYFRILSRLGVALNLKYRPHKYDFGLRYLYHDYPEYELKFLEDLLFVEEFNQLQPKLDIAVKRFNELIEELKTDWDTE